MDLIEMRAGPHGCDLAAGPPDRERLGCLGNLLQ